MAAGSTEPDGERLALLSEALTAFGVRAPIAEVERLGGGHIHRTDAVTLSDGAPPVVLQQLNGTVFRDLPACEENLRRIDEHLRRNERSSAIAVPHHLRTEAGLIHATLADGSTWRATERIVDVIAPESIENADQAATVAGAFGAYVAALSTLRGAPLRDTIPRFHDFAWRVEHLALAVRSDPIGRANRCELDIDLAHTLADIVGPVAVAQQRNATHTVHNDAKVTNLLCSVDTGLPVAVVDLDTTMVGSPLNDLGELIRSAATMEPEDSVHLDAIEVRDDIVSALIDGFVSSAGVSIDPDLVRFAGPIMAVENGLRFLTDHLNGDRYFAITRPSQNLARARMQLRLARLLLDR